VVPLGFFDLIWIVTVNEKLRIVHFTALVSIETYGCTIVDRTVGIWNAILL